MGGVVGGWRGVVVGRGGPTGLAWEGSKAHAASCADRRLLSLVRGDHTGLVHGRPAATQAEA